MLSTNDNRHDSLRAPFFKISPYVWYEIGTKIPPDTNSTSISCETKVLKWYSSTIVKKNKIIPMMAPPLTPFFTDSLFAAVTTRGPQSDT